MCYNVLQVFHLHIMHIIDVVKFNPKYFRPAEVETLLGNPTKAKEVLGWTPTYTFNELVEEMVLNGQ